MGKQCQTLFFWAPMATAAMKLKDAYSLEEKLWPTWIAYWKAETLLCQQGSDWLLRSILLMDLISSSIRVGAGIARSSCVLGHSVLVARCRKQVCGNHANNGSSNLITGVAVIVFSTGWLCFMIVIIFPRNLALNLVFQLFCELLNILFEIPFWYFS